MFNELLFLCKFFYLLWFLSPWLLTCPSYYVIVTSLIFVVVLVGRCRAAARNWHHAALFSVWVRAGDP